MPEVTVLTRATSKSNSLRTTVPSSIVKLLELREGDRLKWIVKVRDNRLVILIEPLRRGDTGAGKGD